MADDAAGCGCGCVGCLAWVVVVLALGVAIKYLWQILVS